MELSIIKVSGESTGRKASLINEVFAIEPNDHAIYLDVKSHLANMRQGTHKSKQRNEVSGSSKKIKKQKGTGGARAGNIKNPQFTGGGRVFGPVPRDYSFKLNRKVKALARKSALTYKAKDNSISVIEDFSFQTIKTKNFTAFLKAIKVEGDKTLLVLPSADRNIVLAGRNLPNTRIITADQINTYDVLNAEKLLLVESAVGKIANILNKES